MPAAHVYFLHLYSYLIKQSLAAFMISENVTLTLGVCGVAYKPVEEEVKCILAEEKRETTPLNGEDLSEEAVKI